MYEDVCAQCFEDPDLQQWVANYGGEPGCFFCERDDAPTAPLDELVAFMLEKIDASYGDANEYIFEGEIAVKHWFIFEMLQDEIALELPRDNNGRLFDALLQTFGDGHVWCEYDPAVLEDDENMLLDWERFCSIVKYDRRFFFHDVDDQHDPVFEDSLSPRQLLKVIERAIASHGLIVRKDEGYEVYRARAVYGLRLAQDLGPPAPDQALQWNRMNPPGIPMFYAAENAKLAIAEIGQYAASIGRFRTMRKIRLLDLADLPRVPGIFSDVERRDRLALQFLHKFARRIVEPVARERRTVLDYIPTQVFTEFLRDATFEGRRINGVRYRSATRIAGANVVLFATRDDIAGVDGGRENPMLQLHEAYDADITAVDFQRSR